MLKIRNKNIFIVIVPLVLLVLLVLIKSLNEDSFEVDLAQTHKMSLNQSHIINLQQFMDKNKIAGVVLIDLRNKNEFKKGSLQHAMNIPFAEILENQELKKLKSSDNELILYSNSISVSAKAWIILSQMDYKKLYILDVSAEIVSENLILKDSILIHNEMLNFKFKPDSIKL